MVLLFFYMVFNFYFEYFFCLMFWGCSVGAYGFFFNVFLMSIFSIVLMFSLFYMKSYLFFFYYFYLFFSFLMMMVMINFVSSFHLIFFVWDMLGLISFFLVIYYLNWESLSGALNTIFSNRWGDFFLIYFFCVDYSILNNWLVNFSLFFLFFGCLTKSAQFPFFGWLVKAMVAPTPVSALVHSSTLVVSGCFLMYIYVEKYNYLMMFWLTMISLIGMAVAGFLSLLENDFKKIIAWSTMSQVSLIFFFFSFGWFFYSFLYLVNHALFKSLIFLTVGLKIFYESGGQDIRFNKSESISFLCIIFFLGFFSLSGLFFSGGMILKESILDYSMFEDEDLFYLLMINFNLLGTNFYSLKILFFFYKNFFSFFNFISFFGCVSFFFLGFLSFFSLYFLVNNFVLLEIEVLEDFCLWGWFIYFFFYYYFFNIHYYMINSKFLANYWFNLFKKGGLSVSFNEGVLYFFMLMFTYIYNLFFFLKWSGLLRKYFFFIFVGLMIFFKMFILKSIFFFDKSG